ncbi:MAG: sigma-70 family RNA polymerase sigma factor [Acidobacteriota bacterium]|nr:sigma-70 family RNA polymerase sigma factor [Acidobacteriota bacterium]
MTYPGVAVSPSSEHVAGGSLNTVSEEPVPLNPSPDWFELVERIKRQEESGMEDLYQLFSRGIRYYLCRQLGPQDLDDKVHDSFLIVVQAIRRGDLREPERLMGFVRTVVRRQIAGHIDIAVQARKQQVDLESGHGIPDLQLDPEKVAIHREHEAIAGKVLKGISKRDREILTRFYLEEESQDEICTRMNLTETQFRLLKSRAKARFGEMGRRKIGRRIAVGTF